MNNLKVLRSLIVVFIVATALVHFWLFYGSLMHSGGLSVTFNQWPGLHKEPYWMEHTTDYLNFYTLPWKNSK